MSKALALLLMVQLAVPAFASVFTDAQSAARDGQFDLAVETIDGILRSLPADSTERRKFEQRRARYRQDQPYNL